MVAFYSAYFWQEERFFLRLAPAFCLLDGLGAYALICYFLEKPRWQRIPGIACVLCVIGALIFSLFYFSAKKLVLQSDDNVALYTEMRVTDAVIEKNAVLITRSGLINMLA
jgi:drug/metabolite transporter (DMT)-like permease